MPTKAQAARLTVDRLESQAVALRAELLGLQNDVAQVRRDFSGMRAVQLLEANEQLVVAALHAEAIAETAAGDLSALVHTSRHDPLTDAPNRLLMLDRLGQAIALAHRRGTRVALLFIDLDRFKEINDAFGHAAGDQVLQLVVRRLNAVVRESDTVSRHGGDEFLVLLSEIAHVSDAGTSARKILAALEAPNRIGGIRIPLTASIGIATYPDDGRDATTLIAHADAAMYCAKQRGRGRVEFYDPTPNAGEVEQPRATAWPAALQPPAAGAANPDPSLLQALQQANEHLLVAALTAQEDQAKAEAKQRRQARRLAVMAHELRSPLAPIRTAASLLKCPVRDAPMIAQLQTIIESRVDSMSDRLDDLIEGSDALTSPTRLERRPADLTDILHMAAEMCRLAMHARQQRFVLDLPAGPMPVHADASRLVQVFCNLLDNASTYTPVHGRIALTAVIDGPAYVVAVTDSGIGMAPGASPAAFDLFSAGGSSSLAGSEAGTRGIGLVVVSELVAAHDGTVRARSDGEGLGSEFVVTLPVHA